jgi:hypothetical protein
MTNKDKEKGSGSDKEGGKKDGFISLLGKGKNEEIHYLDGERAEGI